MKQVDYSADNCICPPELTDGDRLLIQRTVDAVRLAEFKGSPRFIGFLDGRGRKIVSFAAAKEGFSRLAFFGGYDGAERVFAGFFPDYAEPCESDFPVCAFTLCYRESASLSHRDFLGTLMSLGIKRESVGDILCGEGFAVIFLSGGVSDYIESQLEKVGGEGVTVLKGVTRGLPAAHGFSDISCTVASMRLDCVVAALCGVSRGKASELICDGLVTLDSFVRKKTDISVTAGSTVSVRGFGRFAVDGAGRTTKKGRTVLNARKYI